MVPANAFAAKYKSKKEIFGFLSVTVGHYLCDYRCLTIYFLKDLVSGQKKCKYNLIVLIKPPLDIKCDNIKYIFVPQYESLSLK